MSVGQSSEEPCVSGVTGNSGALRRGRRITPRLGLGHYRRAWISTIFTLFPTPIAYRILAPFSKPRAEETRLLIEELKAAPR